MEVIAVESPRLKHRHVEAEIRRMARTLSIGARLPSERRLAETYGCNFLTVRRALKELVDDGTVVRRVGSGTFVSKHPMAKAPVAASGERLGLLVWQGGDAYAYRVLQGLAQEATAQGVELRSSWIRSFTQEGMAQGRFFEQEGCSAIILPWFPHDERDDVRAFVRGCSLPVSLPMVIPGLEANSFEQQEVFGGSQQTSTEQLCAYFHALGHRRIALLGPDAPDDGLLHRQLGAYACYTSRANLPNDCGLVRPGAPAMSLLAERWAKYRGDLAVVSYDDEHALRFMTAMHKLGLNAPDDFQIIGYNDTEASAFSDPPLTTIRQNFTYIGHWLIKNALALSRGEVAQSTVLPRLQMQVRSTCGGAPFIDEAFRQQFPNLDFVLGEDSESADGSNAGSVDLD